MWNKNLGFIESVELYAAAHPKYFKKFWEEYVSKF
jgi:hypothetical protein